MARAKDYELVVYLIMFGGILLGQGLYNFRKKRRIEDAARIDIGSAPQGLVELEGFAWPAKDSLVAVCGRRVVYYEYKVQEYVSSGKRSSWETRYSYEYSHPFYLMDHSGVCLVDPQGVKLNLKEQITELKDYAEDIEGLRRSINLQVNSGFFGKLFSGTYRLVEGKIYIGSPVYVHGSLKSLNQNEVNIPGDYSKFIDQMKSIKKNLVYKMLSFDKNKDGVLTDVEHAEGCYSIARQFFSGTSQNVKLVGQVSNSEVHKLIIADCHQDHLLQRFSGKVTYMILIGIAMVALGLVYLAHFKF